MSAVSIGDLARNLLMQQSTFRVKSRLNSLTGQLASERKSDVGAAVSGNFRELAGITSGVRQLDTWGKAAGLQVSRASAMQNALGRLNTEAQSLSTDLLLVGDTTTLPQDQVIAADARRTLGRMMDQLNQTHGLESVFAGVTSDRPALGDVESLLTALRNEISGLTDVQDITLAIADWFNSPTGYEAQLYQGGPPRSPLRISATEFSDLSVTALDPAIRSTLEGAALAVISSDFLTPGYEGMGKALMAAGAEKLINSGVGHHAIAARLGIEEEHLARVQSRQSAELSVLTMRNADLVAADPYDTATELETTRAQLDLLFTLTARLSELSLAKVLR